MSNRRLTFGLVGGALGVVVGLLIGLAVVRNDEATPPRTELVPVSIPTLSTTAAPTPPTNDSPLAVAPSDTTPGASTVDPTAAATTTTVGVDLGQCENYFTRPEGLPVQKCDRSETVRLVQQMLQTLGYDLVADGIFGPGTARAVIAYQSSNGLTANGVVDGNTFDSLCAAAPGGLCDAA